MEAFDVVVIGAGPGGYPAAIRAAQLGASVAVIEKEFLGGTCLNSGCIPSKVLIHSADLCAQMRSSARYGLHTEGLSVDYAGMVAHKDEVVLSLRNGVKHLLDANAIRIFQGSASFQTRNRIRIEGGNFQQETLEASKTIIATGAKASVPRFLPQHDRVLDSKSFLDLRVLPSSVLIMGGGIIGCEFACMLAQLGVKVCIVELLDDILSMLDADVRREVRNNMEKNLGIRVLTGHAFENVVADERGVRGTFAAEKLEADVLLVATGRVPVTRGLCLENAGLQTNSQGFIEVDEFGRSAVSNIFVIGDVTGGPQLAHAATAQGIVAAENACTNRLQKNDKLIPYCIFTSPEVGAVGVSEQEAHQRQLNVETGKFHFAGLGKARAIGDTHGFTKWVADAQTGQLLGAQVVGPHATELIAEAVVAIRGEFTVTEFSRTIHAHPTLSEAWMEAASAIAGVGIHSRPKNATLKKELVGAQQKSRT